MAIKRDNADDFCKGKKDGKYAIADVFVYIDCKGGKSTKTNCPSQEIFSEVDLKCVSIATQSFTQFCNHRESNIDWRNPWDCSSYIDCANGRSLKRKCLINGFVFNPDEDVCMKPSQFPCFQVGSAREMPKSLTENTPGGLEMFFLTQLYVVVPSRDSSLNLWLVKMSLQVAKLEKKC